MKTIAIMTIASIAVLVLMRLNGIATDIPVLDAVVSQLMQSMHLA